MGNQEEAKNNISNITGGAMSNQEQAKYNVSNINRATWVIRKKENLTLVISMGNNG